MYWVRHITQLPSLCGTVTLGQSLTSYVAGGPVTGGLFVDVIAGVADVLAVPLAALEFGG